MKDLVLYLAKALVNHPDEVEVKEIQGETAAILELRVAKDDSDVLLESKDEPQNPSGRYSTQLLHERIAKLSLKSLKRNEAPSETRVVPLGRLVNTHGVRGELRFLPYFPAQLLKKT
jgi:hypothetical protein